MPFCCFDVILRVKGSFEFVAGFPGNLQILQPDPFLLFDVVSRELAQVRILRQYGGNSSLRESVETEQACRLLPAFKSKRYQMLANGRRELEAVS